MNGQALAVNSRGVPVGFGLAAGVLATLPMTAAMMLMHRFLKVQERYPLPPRIIMTRILGGHWGGAITVDRVEASRLNVLTVASHFAYGGACGTLFAIAERFVPAPRAVKGLVFGLLVWAGSYMAWLPALGILAPAREHPPRRTALMVIAHLVWGASMGLLLGPLARLRRDGSREAAAAHHQHR